MGTPTSSHAAAAQQLQVVGQGGQVLDENGGDTQLLTSTPIIKSEGQKVETIVTMDPNNMIPVTSANASTGEITTATGATVSSGGASGSTSTPKAKRTKHPPGTESEWDLTILKGVFLNVTYIFVTRFRTTITLSIGTTCYLPHLLCRHTSVAQSAASSRAAALRQTGHQKGEEK